MDNVLRSSAGLVLHDFDLTREGWRVGDLVRVRSTPHWPAFAEGYTRRRDLPEPDLAELPWLQVVGSISNLHFHLVQKAAFRGTESLSEGGVEHELAILRRLKASLVS